MIKLIFRQFEISISHITGECALIKISKIHKAAMAMTNLGVKMFHNH